MGGTEADKDLFPNSAEDYGESYKEHLFEQYKLYVDSADKVSSRRALANTFFLTIASALLSGGFVLVGTTYSSRSAFDGIGSTAVSVGSLLLAVSWVYALRSYSQLNAGKFKIIHKIESKLPASPYTKEWQVLGKGRSPERYLPLTEVEKWVPRLFIFMYLVMLTVSVYPLLLGFP
jgi:hypothetical protein